MPTATPSAVKSDRSLTIRIPAELFEALEREARKRRKATGDLWTVSQLVRVLLAEGVRFPLDD